MLEIIFILDIFEIFENWRHFCHIFEKWHDIFGGATAVQIFL